jgi:hypothetical protein
MNVGDVASDEKQSWTDSFLERKKGAWEIHLGRCRGTRWSPRAEDRPPSSRLFLAWRPCMVTTWSPRVVPPVFHSPEPCLPPPPPPPPRPPRLSFESMAASSSSRSWYPNAVGTSPRPCELVSDDMPPNAPWGSRSPSSALLPVARAREGHGPGKPSPSLIHRLSGAVSRVAPLASP